MLRETGTAKLNVAQLRAQAAQADPIFQAVREAASADYDVLGEIGRSADGTIAYLARERATSSLVALKLQRDPGSPDEFTLDVVRQLDASMPAENRCTNCGRTLEGWARFCTGCGADLSGAAAPPANRAERVQLLAAVQEAVIGQYEVLGEMERKEGGGVVYFAQEIATGRIVALRLQKDAAGGEDSYALGLTTAMKPFAASLGVKAPATQVLSATTPPPPPPPPAPPPVTPMPTPAAAEPTPVPAPGPKGGMSTAVKALIGVAALLAIAVVVLLLRPKPSPAGGAADTTATAGGPVTAPAPTDAAAPTATGAAAPAAGGAGGAATPATGAAPAPAGPPAPPPAEAAEETGTLKVAGLPKGARLTIDGKARTGSSFTLKPGDHIVALTASGYEPFSESVSIVAGQVKSWSPTLTPLPVSQAPAPAPRPATPKHEQPAPAPAPVAAGPSCKDAFNASNWAEAMTACAREAEGGDQDAQYLLGFMYDKAKAGKRDIAQAKHWYGKSAAQGNKPAKKALEGIEREEAQNRRPF